MNPLRRLASMEREELRFRLTCELRKLASRAQWAMAPPRWDRSDLNAALSPASQFDSTSLAQARAAARRKDWPAAHQALSSHFFRQPSAFPLEARAVRRVVERIRARFSGAPADSEAHAARILEGRYDILGYEGVPFGRPPQWHRDPIHGRTAPDGFWSEVPYLDPAAGDHKVIWEINRHQHWLSLGRAYHLTADTRYYDEFVTQLEDWLAANPPLSGVNWASMLELGFRSLSWLWALHLFAGAAVRANEESAVPAVDHPWTVDLLIGLDRQLDHIEQNLSRYFSPNTHLTGEALALYVAGVTLPELAASGRRSTLGRAVLLQEIDRQVGADGLHAELSAHYHRYSTDFYLLATLVARASRDPEAGRFAEAALRQARCLRALADDRGRLPLIGDDDGGQLFPICGRAPVDCRDTLASAAAILETPELAIGETPEETFWLCGSTLPLEPLAIDAAAWPSTALPSSGYYVSRGGSGDHLIFDAGPHGFLNGGHAHSDALSIVLTTGSVPFLVDPGTATYTMAPEVRDRFRSTAMHNTVVMNGRPQSEPGGPFHWRSRARAVAPIWRSTPDADYVEGRHDGYAPQVHARGILTVHGLGWFIVDHFLGPGEAATDAHWHLHPDWTIAAVGGQSIDLHHRDGRRQVIGASAGMRPVSGPDAALLGVYARAYGHVEPAPCLVSHSSGPLPRSVLTFVPATARSGQDVSVQVAASGLMPDGWHAAAWRIRHGGMTAIVMAAIERSGIAASPDAAPETMWGPAEARTNARVALLVSQDSQPVEAILVNGSRLESHSASIDLGTPSPLGRFALHATAAHP